VLDRSIELAKVFGTDRVRLFDFWRLDDQAPYRAAMNEKLREAAEKAAKENIILILEMNPPATPPRPPKLPRFWRRSHHESDAQLGSR